MAAVGGMWYVMGSSSEIAASAPMPGNTPMSVPRNTPMKQYSSVTGFIADSRPIIRPLRMSMVLCLSVLCGVSGLGGSAHQGLQGQMGRLMLKPKPNTR